MTKHSTAALLCLLFSATACMDATLPSADQHRSGASNAVPANVYVLDPYTVVVDPTCDPWLDADWCEGDGSQCMTAAAGATLAGCDTYPIGGGAAPDETSGSVPPPPTAPTDSIAAEEEGVLLWGACILALVSSVYSIDQVGGAFKGWWDAKKTYDRAKSAYDYAWNNRETLSDPSLLAVTQLRLDIAQQNLEAAVGTVKDLTGVSVLALLAAAVTCGPAAVLPTP